MEEKLHSPELGVVGLLCRCDAPTCLAGCAISSLDAAQWTSWIYGWASFSSGSADNICRAIWVSNSEQGEQLCWNVSLPESHGNAKSSATIVNQTLLEKSFLHRKKPKTELFNSIWRLCRKTTVLHFIKSKRVLQLCLWNKQFLLLARSNALWTFELNNNPQQCFLGSVVIMNWCSHLDTSSYC